MLTPGWADTRTQWKNCHMSCKLQVELITEKEKEEEKEAIWSVWHCSKHHRTGTSSDFSFSGSGYFAKLLFGKAFFNNLSVPEHYSASSVCTPTSGIHGKLQADWGTASPFFKICFLLICESHLYHSKVVVILLGLRVGGTRDSWFPPFNLGYMQDVKMMAFLVRLG